MLNDRFKMLVVTSVAAEKNAFQQGFGNLPNVDIEITGVGPFSATLGTTKLLVENKYDFVLCIGIAGGFQQHAPIGTVVLSDRVIAADLGAQSAEGYLSLEDLQLGSSQFVTTSQYADQFTTCLQRELSNTVKGTILTLSTVTGTKKTMEDLTIRYPDAVAEAMEGFGVASAAHSFDVPFLEIRAISNHIGPRDKSKWNLQEAFAQIQNVGKVFRNMLDANSIERSR
jgi:futalosine hydrolase